MVRSLALLPVFLLGLLAGSGAGPASAQETGPAVVITPGEGRAFRAAVQIFLDRAQPADPGRAQAFREEVEKAMEFSDVLLPLADDAFLGARETAELESGPRGDCADWAQGGADALVEGILESSGARLRVDYQVWDTARCRSLARGQLERPAAERPRLAKLVADQVVAAFTGTPGVAGTEIAFISDRSGTREV